MGKIPQYLLFLSLVLSHTSCSSIRRMGINSISPTLYQSGDAFIEEANWENFRSAIPANIKILEGLLKSSPNNEKILSLLTKSYAGQAFGVWETLYLGDVWAEKEGAFFRRQTVEAYSQAVRYGMLYFEKNGVTLTDLHQHLRKPQGIAKLLRRKIGKRSWDIEAIFFTAQSLAGLINLQKSNIALVGELSLAKELFDYACTLRPDIHFGACPLFYGSYEAGRPSMLGGNPEKGRKIFERSIKKYPENYLIRLAFIEHYIIPKGKKSLYKKQKKVLNKALTDYRNNLIWSPTQTITPSPLRLYQSIALKRFEMLKKHEKEIF